MSNPTLFSDLPTAPEAADSTPTDGAPAPSPAVRPRVLEPDRNSVRLMTSDLDSLLPPDHNARAVWAYVQRMDLSPLYAAIRARGSHPGRPSIDPALLMALWLFATLEGVGSARALARLCKSHIAYRCLCGGVTVNYHTLSDFRVKHVELLEKLLVDGVATLMAGGLVDMARVAQDGMRVRASAGAASFKRRKTIERAQRLAREQVERLRDEAATDPDASNRRQRAARQRAAKERMRRLDAALKHMAELERTRRTPKNKKKRKVPTGTSTTPPAKAQQQEEEDKKSAPPPKNKKKRKVPTGTSTTPPAKA